MENLFDYILVVSCKKEIAIERMMENRGYTKEEARARYQSQSKQRKEMLKADFVLYNDTCISDLEKKLDAVMKELKKG
ncbi:MAG: dephospho-CoA kinase, partial [Solobacterium sp.]|nr:dephospho-CoA kinase [Solobacterium sp.]